MRTKSLLLEDESSPLECPVKTGRFLFPCSVANFWRGQREQSQHLAFLCRSLLFIMCAKSLKGTPHQEETWKFFDIPF